MTDDNAMREAARALGEAFDRHVDELPATTMQAEQVARATVSAYLASKAQDAPGVVSRLRELSELRCCDPDYCIKGDRMYREAADVILALTALLQEARGPVRYYAQFHGDATAVALLARIDAALNPGG